MRLTRVYSFAASHRLHTEALDAGENREIFGKCNNPFGHGHNYHVAISVTGPVDPVTGTVISVPELDAFVNDTVLDRLQYANLNADIAEFATVVPTTENLALYIRKTLDLAWPWASPRLERVRIQETKNNFFEVNGKAN